MTTVVEADRRIPADALQGFVSELFSAAGMSEGDAGRVAAIVVGTDLRGVYSHGTAAVAGYVGRMLDGLIDPAGQPRVTRQKGGTLVVDGANNLGHIALTFAMDEAVRRARDHGIAAAAVGHSNHCGAMASYAMQALPHDMIGLVTTNGLPTMGFYGGLDRILSINPIGIAIPAGVEVPFVLDTSFGAVARGKILVHHQKGLALPDGWAFDRDGRPTTDPAAALDGLIQPSGGYKGASLALVMGILSALLSGASYGTDLGDFVSGAKPGHDGQFALVLDIGAFEDPARFKERMDGIIRQVHASRPAPGIDRVSLPGERAVATEARYRQEGVPVSDTTRAALVAIAQRAGVDAGVVA